MKDWLDGPGLARWLDERGYKVTEREHGALAKRVREWARGERACVYTVDNLAVRLGFHISEIPDHLYRDGRNPRTYVEGVQGYPKTIRRMALKEVRAGRPYADIARDLNIHVRTLRNWRRAEKVA